MRSRILRTLPIVALGVALVLGAVAARADAPAIQHRLTIADPAPAPASSEGDFFGQTVGLADIDGDGVPDVVAPRTTDAYVFSGATGDVLLHLTVPDPQADLHFGGIAVTDLDGDGHDDIIVGAPLSDGFEGRVYVFSANTGALEFKLSAPDAGVQSEIGQSLAIVTRGHAVDLLVGAPGATVDGLSSAGAIYVYSGETQALERTITSPTPQQGEGFGFSLALGSRQSVIAVDAIDARIEAQPAAGRVYLLSTDGLALGAIDNPDPTGMMFFGAALDIADAGGKSPSLAIGSLSRNLGGPGEVDLYEGTTLRHTLTTPGPQTQSDFGLSLAFVSDGDGDDETLIVAAPLEQAANGAFGRLYEFGANGTLLGTIDPPSAADLGFGFPLTFADDHCGGILTAGAPGAGIGGLIEVFALGRNGLARGRCGAQ